MVFSSCAHKITRSGYEAKKTEHADCPVTIKKFYTVPDSAKKVGEVKLGDSGFSTACNEDAAIKILKAEACALNANLVVIVEESRPSIMSSCYSCKAKIYKYNSSEIQEDPDFASENIKTRVNQDRKSNTAMIFGALIGGFVFGLLFL